MKPATKCTVCKHARRSGIEAALAEGSSLRVVAKRFKSSRGALERHVAHAPKAPRTRAVVPPVVAPVDLKDMRGLGEELRASIQAQLEAVRSNPALGDLDRSKVLAQLGVALERLGRETRDELDERKIVRLPAFRAVVEEIRVALVPWPEAMVAVGRALTAIDASRERPST